MPERARRLYPHIPRSYFSRCLSRPPRSFFPSVFPSSSLPSPLPPPLSNHHGHPLTYTVIAEAPHDARRLHTHRSRRLARHNRGSTTTTDLTSVTPNRERATTAWFTNWTLGTSLQAFKTPSNHIPVGSDTIATVASDPCRDGIAAQT